MSTLGLGAGSSPFAGGRLQQWTRAARVDRSPPDRARPLRRGGAVGNRVLPESFPSTLAHADDGVAGHDATAGNDAAADGVRGAMRGQTLQRRSVRRAPHADSGKLHSSIHVTRL